MIWLIVLIALIVVLLAAVLITLLKAWNSVFMVIGGIVVWILAVFVLSEMLGDVGAKVGIIGPLVLVLVGGALGLIIQHMPDKSKRPPSTAQKNAAKRRAALTALRNERKD